MMDNHVRIRTGKVCGTLSFALLLVMFLSLKFDFYYDLNDDTMIKDILSGAYTGTPSGFCIQMLYPLSWFIALFYKAIPALPWYGLFLCLCQFGVITLITWRLMSLMKTGISRVIALIAQAAVILGLFLRELVIIQYSVTSGMCMAGAVFLFVTTPQTDKAYVFLRKNLLPAFLVILSFMIRTEVCLMLLPFLLLAGISKWCSETKFFTGTNIKKYLILIMTAILGMLAVYSLDMYAYRSSDWSSFRGFFDARTKLYDFYGLPGYDDNKELYEAIGLSKESYTLLENYNFALDDSIDTWSLEAIVEYQEQLAAEGKELNYTFGFVSKNSISEAVWLYKKQLTDSIRNKDTVSLAVMAAYAVYVIAAVLFEKGKKRGQAFIKIILLVLIRCILWLYLYMVDRVLERVTISLFMLELTTIISFIISDFELTQNADGKVNKAAVYILTAVCALGLIFAVNKNIHDIQEEYDKRAAADERWNVLMEYCKENGQNYYVIDVYSSTSYNGAPYSEKMFKDTDNSYRNFDICGGWAVKSPVTRQKLERMGLSNIQNALYGKNKTGKTKTYFVADAGKDLKWLSTYYKKRGINIKIECADVVKAADDTSVFEVFELVYSN